MLLDQSTQMQPIRIKANMLKFTLRLNCDGIRGGGGGEGSGTVGGGRGRGRGESNKH